MQYSFKLLVLVFLIGSLVGCQDKEDTKNPPESSRIEVKTRRFSPSSLTSEIPFVGLAEARLSQSIVFEVPGILKDPTKKLVAGTKFIKGEVVAELNSERLYYDVLANRSRFLNNLSIVVSDLQLDFPQRAPVWQQYLNDVNIEETIPDLPTILDKTEKRFLISRGILQDFYQLKSLETQLNNFQFRAPFDGWVTEVSSKAGNMVQPGQPIGEFTQLGSFDVTTQVLLSEYDYLQVGLSVTMTSQSLANTFKGIITSINPTITKGTQAITVTIRVLSEDLMDGMVLTGSIVTDPIPNVVRLDQSVVVDDEFVYEVIDQKLVRKKINILRREKESVLVSGFDGEAQVVNQVMPIAYEGLSVKPVIE